MTVEELTNNYNKLEKVLDKAIKILVEKQNLIIWEYSLNLAEDSKNNTYDIWKEKLFKENEEQ